MRWDEIGIIWQDIKEEKIKKEPRPKREPPEPVWLQDDYLPWLEEAKQYNFDEMNEREIELAHYRQEPLVWDIEVYPNYFLAGFKSIVSNKIISFELWADDGVVSLDEYNARKFRWILEHFLIIGFNSFAFDMPIATAAINGYNCEQLMDCVNDLIFNNVTSWDFNRHHKFHRIRTNQIDLIELTALSPSLKITAGRLHAPRMQDLPFTPGKILTPDQITTLRWYWANDLNNTKLLYEYRKPEIDLRKQMYSLYHVDVRSKSDPQIAEAIIRKELREDYARKHKGEVLKFQKAEIIPGRMFKYTPPSYLQYFTPKMQATLELIRRQEFVVDLGGGPLMPPELKDHMVEIGNARYNLGIGGLHSQEKRSIHIADNEYEITDNDVTSYYPSLILKQNMYPPHVGPAFLSIFAGLYKRRLEAKASGDKITADTLKIVLNGTFGKTGERGGNSVVYYPEMMIAVTVTGQLLLLWLIEVFELNGIEVISANTDGVMIKCHRSKLDVKAQIMKWWEGTTSLQLESTEYSAVYLRDVNSYVAVIKDQSEKKYAKTKGAYALAAESGLKKNPSCDICILAVIKHLAKSIPIEQTIRECQDFRQFLEVRRVNGGACKDGEYLGKAIRWAYCIGEESTIINAKNGHDVPRSKGARPYMRLPEELPSDLDYDYYISRANELLTDLYPRQESNDARAAA